MPGVLGVFTGRDLTDDGLGPIPPVAVFAGRDGKPMFAASMPPLAVDRIRYVGEGVAIVVAQTLAQALDASEQVAIDFEELSSAPNVERALAADAIAIHEARPGNIALDWIDGNAGSRTRFSSAATSNVCSSTTRALRRSRWNRAPGSACGTRRNRNIR